MWAGFFNRGFFPSLIFRTITALTVASLAACIVINAMPNLDRRARTELINRAAHFLFPMILMPVLAIWYFGTMPEDSLQMVLGGSVVMTMFMLLASGASLLIGLYAFIALLARRLYINGATAALLCLGFGRDCGR